MKTEFKYMLQLGHRGTEIKKVTCSKKKIKAINNYKESIYFSRYKKLVETTL